MAIYVTGGANAALQAQRIRQISYNTFVTQTAIAMNALTSTLVFLGAQNTQYMVLLENLDLAANIALGGQDVTIASGLLLPANTANRDNPLSRIMMDPVQFGPNFQSGAAPGLFGIASAGTPWLGVFIFQAANDGTS